MREHRIFLVVSLVCVMGSAGAAAEQPASPPLSNWSVAPSWSPSVERTDGLQALSATSPLPFIAVTPCRVADTRGNGFTGVYGPPSVAPGSPRSFPLVGQCGIAPGAEAVSLNVTAINATGPGFLKIYPQGSASPVVSTLNYTAGQTIANAAIVELGSGGVTVAAGVSATDLVIDVNGYYAAAATSFTQNTFLGLFAGNATMSGAPNTAVGFNAMVSNTTGGQNIALGFSALELNTTGAANTAIGGQALGNNVGGTDNVAVGYLALLGNVSGSRNIAIGRGAGFSTNGNDNILIGSPGVAGQGGTIRIGIPGIQGDTFIAGIHGTTSSSGTEVFVNSSGQLGTDTSSRRFKQNIRDIGDGSEGLMRLRPVAFQYKPEYDQTGLQQYGLIAEEVAEVYPHLVVYGDDGQALTVRYHLLVPMLLNEVQKDRRTIADLTAKVADIEELKARLAAVEAKLAAASRP